jgi:hypothetical protein
MCSNNLLSINTTWQTLRNFKTMMLADLVLMVDNLYVEVDKTMWTDTSI